MAASSTSSSNFVSQDEFHLFHKIDRQLYTILAINLGRDPMEAMQIMAFWLWLERVGFRYVVHRMLSLPTLLINELADEAVACLACIASDHPPSVSDDNLNNIPLTQSFMKKEISLQFLHENRQAAKEGATKVLNEVCLRALKDIMQRAISHRGISAAVARPPPYSAGFPGGAVGGGNVAVAAAQVSPDERAMFVTFSKGYPVHEWEVREFFTRIYGDCIESFQMQEVERNEQALFARIVFRSASTIDMILGSLRRIKFTINGKHIWARKFIPKRPQWSPSLPPPLPPSLNRAVTP